MEQMSNLTVLDDEEDRQIAELDPKERALQETPRHTCGLGGAYATACAVPGLTPILHSGGGCGWANFFGYIGASGGGMLGDSGAMMTPCSCLLEKHVVFGGEERLRDQIRSSMELMKGDLYVTIGGCIPALIGDDIDGVVNEFKRGDYPPIINVKSSGFSGTSYEGYEWFFDGLIGQFLKERPVEKGLVNIIGIQPCAQIHWKGDLQVIRQILESIGLTVNQIVGDPIGVKGLERIPAAEYNIVISPWLGINTAKKLQEKFNTPFLVYPGVPIGPAETEAFVRKVGEALKIDKAIIEDHIAKEKKTAYVDFGLVATVLYMGFCNSPFAVVGESNYAIGVLRYLNNECGLLPTTVIITDHPPEEARELITNRLTKNLEGVIVPDVYFENDTYLIHKILDKYSFHFLFGSSMEKYVAGERYLAAHHTISFPAYDRLILKRTYLGWGGGNAFLEDVLGKFGRPF
jgi:nitrogenase molybdenum-iron protein beta chain